MEHGLLNYQFPQYGLFGQQPDYQGEAPAPQESPFNSMMQDYNQQVQQQLQEQQQMMALETQTYEADRQVEQNQQDQAYGKQFVDANKMTTSMALPTSAPDLSGDLARSRNMRMRNLQNYYSGRQ